MSLALDLGICATSSALPRVDEVVDSLKLLVRDQFLAGSNGDIVLRTRTVDGGLSIDTRLPTAVTSDMLHSALEVVTGRQRRQEKVTRVGLLLAGQYQPRPDFFGYMFDAAFAPGSSDPGELTPREGCAVFLSAIERRRQGNAFLEEVIYTAVHELGHLFNLQHSVPLSFMARSADMPTPFPIASCSFNPHEQALLARCSSSKFIWPGGSAFGNLGDLGKGFPEESDNSTSPVGLALKVSVDRDEFWPFEPMELDVTLSVAKGSRSRAVPDFIDPGYEDFIIWIEEPNGERRIYRSPRHYCAHDGKVRISFETPFRRDISIFGESGAYTFRKVGAHRVWAHFRLSPKCVLYSNVIEVWIKGPERSDAYEAARHALSRVDIAQLLYYRRLTPRRARHLPDIEGLREAFPRQPFGPMLQYAVGRSIERLLSSHTRGRKFSKAVGEVAKRHLRRAVDSPSLGDHRRRHAERALDRVSSRQA